MQQPQSAATLKSAINNSKKVFMWTVFGQATEGKTPLGGFIEVYKSHVLGLMKNYELPTSKWDTKVQCFFRTDPENGFLYIEGFRTA